MPDGRIKNLRARVHPGGGDISLLLLSLVLAVGIWFISNLSRSYSTVISVPVRAQSNLEGYSRDAAATSEVMARCRTSGFRILRSRRNTRPVTVFFNPSDLHPDVAPDVFYISSNELSAYIHEIFGEGVQLESFASASVKFSFAAENCKKVPVLPRENLSFRSQYMATGPMRLQPDSVLVYGEQIHLDNVDRVYTAAITLSGLNRDARGMVKLDVPHSVRLSETEVAYSLDVSRYVELSTVVKVGVRNAPPGKDLQVFPSTAEVIYRCVFPLRSNPVDAVEFAVDYRDFVNSVSGRCIPRPSHLSAGVIDYRVEPEVFECIESSVR